MNQIILSTVLFMACAGCMCGDEWRPNLKDKVCGGNPQTSTKIRVEELKNVGYHGQMHFNTPDRVYLFRDTGINLYNMNTNSITFYSLPLSTERKYRLDGSKLNSNDHCVMSGFYTRISDSKQCTIIYYVDENFNFTDITPAGYDGGDRIFKPFFYNNFLYIGVGIKDAHGNFTNCRLLRFSLMPSIELLDDTPVDIEWSTNTKISTDNYAWAYDYRVNSDPSKVMFRFDGTNYDYYGPGVDQIGAGDDFFAIDTNNIFKAYSGVVWQYKSGSWKKHTITDNNTGGYFLESVWASATDNVFVAGTPDPFYYENFCYHYDGSCWTRFYKRDGYSYIYLMWGNTDGSVVLALDINGALLRLYVDR